MTTTNPYAKGSRSRASSAESAPAPVVEERDEAAEVRAMRLPKFRYGGEVRGQRDGEKTIQFDQSNIGVNRIMGQDLPHIPFRWAVDPSGNLIPFCTTTNRGPNAGDRDAKYERFRMMPAKRQGWIFIEDEHVELRRDERGAEYGAIIDEDLVAQIIERRQRARELAAKSGEGSEAQRMMIQLKSQLAESRALERSMGKMADAIATLAGSKDD